MFDYHSYLMAMRDLDEATRSVRFIQACVGGETEKVKLLLDNKDLKVDMYFKDIKGNDGFRWAAIYKHHDVIAELLFTYDYNITKRNLNYIVKSEFFDVLDMIKKKELLFSLNKSLPHNHIAAKKIKV